MALIYRYKLRNDKNSSLDLTIHEDTIQNELEKHFSDNLKEKVRVVKAYFEFKLFTSVENHELRLMGKKLGNISIGYGGFIRMPQELYMILYPQTEGETDSYYVELFDNNVLDDVKGFKKRAVEYTNNYLSKNQELLLNRFINDEKLRNAFYLDVMSSDVDSKVIDKWIEVVRNETVIYSFKGFHRVDIDKTHTNSKNDGNVSLDEFKLDSITDAIWLNKRNLSAKTNKFKTDVFKINRTDKIKQEELDKIIKLIDFKIAKTNKISALEEIEASEKLLFKVHNVGQGLSTSFARGNEPPFLFFDFGMGEGRNAFTKADEITGRVTPNKDIILSHIHRDHWYRLANDEDSDGFRCHWYIPNQELKVQFRHKCAEIIYHKGSVSIITDKIEFTRGILSSKKILSKDPPFPAKDNHKTGLVLRINTCVNGVEGGVLIPGDQTYECINDSMLGNLHILVATHHGGEFGDELPPKPMEDGMSEVVFSYGKDNTHNHPIKPSPYTSWKSPHNTPTQCDYKRYI